jgi:undecaprenyl pyrophosphate synthase
MGACNIDFQLTGKATKEQIDRAFKRQVKHDRDYNGHREGYSGDFQTIDEIKLHNKTFDSYKEAYDYCLENSEKWCYAVAVYVKDLKVHNDEKWKKLATNVSKLELKEDVKELKQNLFSQLKSAKSVKITCKNCTSSLNRSYLQSSNCPMCKQSLFSPTAQNRIDKAVKNNANKLKKARQELKKYESRLASKAKIITLVAGWGAC